VDAVGAKPSRTCIQPASPELAHDPGEVREILLPEDAHPRRTGLWARVPAASFPYVGDVDVHLGLEWRPAAVPWKYEGTFLMAAHPPRSCGERRSFGSRISRTSQDRERVPGLAGWMQVRGGLPRLPHPRLHAELQAAAVAAPQEPLAGSPGPRGGTRQAPARSARRAEYPSRMRRASLTSRDRRRHSRQTMKATVRKNPKRPR